ncbi:hypothetical protein V8F06_001491 [Rhypophila decipiens]
MTSLASLPYLVLLEIGRSLCAHCNPPDDLIPHSIRFAPDRQWRADLYFSIANLSMTCRMLYDIVNPILYHRPYVNNAEHGRYIDLARTLCDRPDLAKQDWLKSAADDDDTWILMEGEVPEEWGGIGWEQVYSCYREGGLKALMIALCGVLPPEDEEDLPLARARRYGDEDSEDIRGGSPVTGGGGQISTGSKLEVLMLESNFGHRPSKAGRFCAPGSLPKLKELYLALHEFRWGFNLDIAMPIFEAAPNLEKIGAWMLSAAGAFGDYRGISWDFDHPDYLAARTVFPLQNVRELDIQNSVLGDHELFWLLKACPRLEVFKYHGKSIMSAADDQFTGQTLQIILERSECARRTLKATPFLEELRIEGPVLAVNPRTGADGAWQDGTSIFHSLDFVALLPTSIRRFEIIANYSPLSPLKRLEFFPNEFQRVDLFYRGLVRLAEAARAGMFPNLAVVTAGWKLSDEERDSLEGKFKLTGVKFLARNEQFHWVGRWD